MTNENLWLKAARDYWRDPANVIGPPGALVRRCIKALWLVLSIYVLFWIAGPSQVASWQLWMKDDDLAMHLAWGFTFASALCFAIVAYAAEGTKPIKMPIFLPKFEGSWKNLRVHTTHLHVPNVRVGLGSLFAASLFFMSLLGMWNYYLHDNLSTGGASVAAIEGSTSRVGEAQTALTEHQAASASALAQVDRAIAETSAGSPTGRSRLVAQRTELMREAAAETARLRTELSEARNATVDVRSTATDPRPVDGIVAGAVGAERSVVASLLDLMRSGVIEAMLVLGAGLGLAGSVSQIGVPKVEPEPVEDEVEETQSAPDAPADPEPPLRRRYVLPAATDDDYAEAAAVGPYPVSSPTDKPAADEPADEPIADDDTPIQDASPANDSDMTGDPLVDELLDEPVTA